MASEAGPSGRTTSSMLDEIVGGTAAELVMAMRYSTAPPGPTFIPALDDAIRFARGTGESSLQRGDMIEINGPSGSGKTSLVLFFLLTRLLPESVNLTLADPRREVEIPIGGRGDQATLIIPTTHRSPIIQLAKAMRSHITSLVEEGLTTSMKWRMETPAVIIQIDDAVNQSLARLKIIRVKPRWRFLALALEGVLHPPSLHLRPHTWSEEANDILAIDGFGDGFWPERWRMEDKGAMGAVAGGRDRLVRGAEDVGIRTVMATIDALRKQMGAVVILTLQALWSSGSTGSLNSHLPSPYPSPFSREREEEGNKYWPLSVQIALTGRLASHQLPADMTLVDALRTLETGDDHGQSQTFRGIVRVPGGSGQAGTVTGVKFSMHIGKEGIEIEG